jgi:hypothetical protein
MDDSPIQVLSLGAGVQSTTLALLAVQGEVTPMPTAAIFADTQSEPMAVYRHLDWLETVLPFPVRRVTAGSLRAHILAAVTGTGGPRMDARPPFYVGSPGQLSSAMLNRQCTNRYKLRPILSEVRTLAGVKPRSPGPRTPVVVQWIGISRDEVQRMKPNRTRWMTNRWPLVDLGMTRADCLAWLKRHGYPRPPKSACTFCPYHDVSMWRALRDGAPDDWRGAVELDAAIRHGVVSASAPKSGKRLSTDQWFVHRSGVPLDQVDLSTPEDHGQLTMFEEECEGLCGV